MSNLYKNKTTIIRITGFVIGIVLMVLGIQLGELNEIMRKAVRVCLECIGIG